VPGTGADAGTPGTDGVSAFTLTAGTQDTSFSKTHSTTIVVADTSMFYVGQYISIEAVGNENTASGLFLITLITTGTNTLTLTYVDTPKNYDGATIQVNKAVAPSGPPITLGVLPTVLTDNTGANSGDEIADGVGVYLLTIPTQLLDLTNNIVSVVTPGHKFRVLGVGFATNKAGAGAGSQAATITPTVSDGTLSGGIVTLGTTVAVGTVYAGTAATQTAANSSSDTATLTLTASGVTAYTAGDGCFVVRIQNMDSADSFKRIAGRINDLINTTLA